MDWIKPEKEEIEIKQMSPLNWAYVGDAVYELAVRTYLLNTTKLKPHRLHIEATTYVKAKAQADTLARIMDLLTEEEKDIVRRGRNAENHHLPKNADPADYCKSTAFEALIGYLYLSKRETRLKEIIDLCLKEK